MLLRLSDICRNHFRVIPDASNLANLHHCSYIPYFFLLQIFCLCRRKPVEEKPRVVSFVNDYSKAPSSAPSSAQVPTKDFQDLKRPKAETSTTGEEVNIYETIKKNNRLTLDSLQTYEHLKVLPAENDYQVLCNSSIGKSNAQSNNSVNPTDAAANLDQDTTLEDDDLYTQI